MTAHNLHAVLDAARHKSTREVELIAAGLSPRPDVPDVVRKLPAQKPLVATSKPEKVSTLLASATPEPSAPSVVAHVVPSPPTPRPAVVAPLSPERFKVQFTVERETHDKLRRLQGLMRHSIPTGDPAAIFDRALTLLIEHLERAKFASAKRPHEQHAAATRSRYIPAAVRREVWRRDAGRCAFVGEEGTCGERGFLEFHHVTPYAFGGAATAENIQLRCRAHNQFARGRTA